MRLRLPDQPFRILILLLEHSGEIVTREELRQKLWPDGTFVDFDHSLNSAVNKLREVLSDSAATPRFIETLARRGYRFLAAVEIAEDGPASSTSASDNTPAVVTKSDGPISLLTTAEELPSVPHGFVRVLFLLIQVMYLTFYIVALARLSQVQDVLEDVFRFPGWVHIIIIVTGTIGIPIRLYLLSSVAFNVRSLAQKFHKLFLPVFILDELWALAPFLLVRKLGWGLALATTAALIYVPFAQRTLLLLRERATPK